MTTHPFLNPSALGQYASAGAARSARVAGVVQDGYRRWLTGLTTSAGETARLVGELGKCRTQADLVALQRELFDHASTRLADDLRAFIELSSKLVAEVTTPVGPVAAPAPAPVIPVPVAPVAVAPAPVETVTEAPAPVVVEEPAPVAQDAPVEVVEAAPTEVVEAAPTEVVEDAPVEVVEDAPVEVVEAAPTEVVEDEATEVVEDEAEDAIEAAPAVETPAAEDAVSSAEAVAAALDNAPVVQAPTAVSARPPRGKAPRGGRSNPRSKPAPAH